MEQSVITHFWLSRC